MDYKRIIQDAHDGYWVMGNQTYPTQFQLCEGCGAVVADTFYHSLWHEQLEAQDA